MPHVSFVVEINTAGPGPTPPDPPAGCDEVGNAARVNVSAYNNRLPILRLRRGSKRCLAVNFAGVMAKGRTITRADIRILSPYTAALSNGRIVGREVVADIEPGMGRTLVRCDATLDNAEVYPMLFEVISESAPWFSTDAVTPAGTERLTILAT